MLPIKGLATFTGLTLLAAGTCAQEPPPMPVVFETLYAEQCAVCHGEAFPRWQDNLIVGSLKGTELYRFVVDGGTVVHKELLFRDAGRIRDVATGIDGTLYLLIEHDTGSKVLRLVPAEV